MSFSDDPLALGVYNYHFQKKNIPIKIHSRDFDVDEVLPSYFFRTENQMPDLECKALDLCDGKVLDIGACVGCHSVVLEGRKLDVTAFEKSPLCCEVMRDRGLRNVVNEDIYEFEDKKFDTILLLMNGAGIAGTLRNVDRFLIKLKQLLQPGGQILIDSSDLIYLYMDDDGSALIDLNSEHYYGELVYQTEYQGKKGKEFPWLYIDKNLLALKTEQNGLMVDQVFEGEHYDYLARIIAK